MQRPLYIVMQCYGKEEIFYECAFALLTFCKHNPLREHTEIWLYTDNKKWFDRFKDCPLQLRFKEIDTRQIQAWRGKIDFVHRVKIEVLRHMTQQHEGCILYLDTDIVFTGRIDHMRAGIDAGSLWMHVAEGIVKDAQNPLMKKLARFLKGSILESTMMWNAGVLGFNTTYSYLLDEVLAFTDKTYGQFPKHIVEQFAFSVYFNQAGEVHMAAPFVTHYWSMKEVRPILASFFTFYKDAHWHDLVHLSDSIQIPVLLQEKMNFLENRSHLGKLKKDKWQPAIPGWAELAKQL